MLRLLKKVTQYYIQQAWGWQYNDGKPQSKLSGYQMAVKISCNGRS